ncbi:MAG: hypothetical protein ABIW76_09320 [Fibrobacteria bacterium]
MKFFLTHFPGTPRLRKAALAAFGLLAAFSGCRNETPGLTSVSKAAQSGPDCASCHAYPLRDTNHVYHLFETSSSITNNRPITCLHCHNTAIMGRDTAFQDSIFLDPNGNEFHALDFPDIPEIRGYPLVRVETLVRNRPIAMPPRPGPEPVISEWITSVAHMNGVVDVVFDPSSIDTSRFRGAPAEFNPKTSTCSAMACHPNQGPYRWAIPSRNLPILKGESPTAE